MKLAETIQEKLERAFLPLQISVKDESHLHEGHEGAREGGETHFRVTVVSQQFEGLTRVARQRCVHEVLDAEFKSRIHALAMTLLTPSEASRRM